MATVKSAPLVRRRFCFFPALNAFRAACDQGQAPALGRGSRGSCCMESIRPENTDPIPVRTQPPQMGSIIIRFVGLLLIAIVALAIVWLR
jgi:hypothetical protein